MKKILGLLLLLSFIFTLSCGDDDERTTKPLVISTVPYPNQVDVKPGSSTIVINFYEKVEIVDLNNFILRNEQKEEEQTLKAVKKGDNGFTVSVTLEPSTDYLFVIPGKTIKAPGSNLYMDAYNLTFRTVE